MKPDKNDGATRHEPHEKRSSINKFSMIMNIITAGGLLASAVGLWAAFSTIRQIDGIESLVAFLETSKMNYQFPDNIPPITEMIEKAESNLALYIDFINYGSFSAPENAKKYYDAIEKKLLETRTHGSTIHVSIYMYSDSITRRALRQQFPKSYSLDKIKKLPNYEGYIQNLSAHPDLKPIIDTMQTIYGFRELLYANNKREKDNLRKRWVDTENSRNIDIVDIDQELPFFMWISDGQAIVSFQSYHKGAKEYSVKTSDPRLIDIFHNVIQARLSH